MIAAGEVKAIGRGVTELRADPGPEVRLHQAVLLSLLLTVWGNVVVVVGRRFGHPEQATLIAHPLLAAVQLALFRRAGVSRAALGLIAPQSPSPSHRRALAGLGAIVAVFVATAFIRRPALPVVRLIVGTAAGEEVLHRAVALYAWSRTDLPTAGVLAATGVTFGAWHVAGAIGGRGAAPLEVLIPAVGAVPFCWLRLRYRSVVPAWLAHLLTNLPGVVSRTAS